MLPSFANETVTVRRAPTVNQRGTTVRDWANATTSTVAGCSLQVGGVSGEVDDRESSALTATLYAPPTADIKKGDRIACDGITWTVVGSPYVVGKGTTLAHRYVSLAEWEG